MVERKKNKKKWFIIRVHINTNTTIEFRFIRSDRTSEWRRCAHWLARASRTKCCMRCVWSSRCLCAAADRPRTAGGRHQAAFACPLLTSHSLLCGFLWFTWLLCKYAKVSKVRDAAKKGIQGPLVAEMTGDAAARWAEIWYSRPIEYHKALCFFFLPCHIHHSYSLFQ